MQSRQNNPQAPARAKADRVEQALRQSAWSTLRSLAVLVDGDVVTLTGYVSRYHEKQMALQEVRCVPGVTQVKDRVEVFHHG